MMLGAFAAAAGAQELRDPTRPAAEISMPSAVEGQGSVAASSGLQSIFISPGRRAAIINGKTIELGAKYGEDKLVEVNEHGVVLQGKQGRQTLALFPGVRFKIKATELSDKNVIPQPKKKTKKTKRNKQPAEQAIEHSEEEK
ncbi:MAG: hypothetical protein Q7S51_03385 [Gallionellaceae bacterium]|nr:hypothetical protein [Gallionellaceae bacterium]